MTMDFEWDESKARANSKKHGVTFQEATEAFGDELSSVVSDPDHSQGEERFLLFGRSQGGECLVVSFTERAEVIRIISARRMTPTERKAYEQ
ncbi:BrnT family toxin [Thiocapsa sp.]|uniref:BrnT family toxin n=1 Tax=Thiocapsa sp. TaxID=2024551 RepID=UPI0034598BE7